MKRKLLALLSLMLCLVLAFSLTSCFGSKDDEEEEVDPKVKAEKWNQYVDLTDLNTFTVKASGAKAYTTETLKASYGVISSDSGFTSAYSSLSSLIHACTGVDFVSGSFVYNSKSFDSKTSSYKLTCYTTSGEEYTVNFTFADKVLTKVVMKDADGEKTTLSFSKWNKTK